jgi:hypothetical protein
MALVNFTPLIDFKFGNYKTLLKKENLNITSLLTWKLHANLRYKGAK